MPILYVFLLITSTSLSAYMNQKDGENIWRLALGIGSTADTIYHIAGELDQAVSLLDLLSRELPSVEAFLSSQYDDIAVDLSLFQNSLNSNIDLLDKNAKSIGDTLGLLFDGVPLLFRSESDELKTLIERDISTVECVENFLESDIDQVHSVLLKSAAIWNSQVDLIHRTILSEQDAITTAIEVLENRLGSSVEQLEKCLIGNPILQSEIPFIINNPGVYTVCENLTLTTGTSPVITIAASEVTLNVGGYTLTTGATNYGIAIGLGGEIGNIQVLNGSIVVGDLSNKEAIIVQSTNGLVIENIHVQNGPDAQISIGSNCNGVILKQCICSGTNGNTINNAGETGAFYIDGLYGSNVAGTTSGIIVENCIAENGTFRGLSCNNITNFTITNTTVFNAAVAGFRIDTNTIAIALTNCTAINSCVGFNVLNNASELSHCSAINNSSAGFVSDVASTNTLFAECEAYENGFGFAIYGSNVLLKRCVVSQNISGLLVDVGAVNTQIFDTCPVNNTTDFTNNSSSTMFINLGTVRDILLSEIEEIKFCCSALDTTTNYMVSSIDSMVSMLNNVGGSNTTETCINGTAITQAMIPFTITLPGKYTLCENIITSGAPAITIGANNVELNLNNHTITNTTDRGILCSGYVNVKIHNGTIIPNLEAVVINNNAQDIALSNIQTINAANVAFRIENAAGVIMDNCICEGSNGTAISLTNQASVYVTSSGSVVLRAVSVMSALLSGFWIQDPLAGGVLLDNCSALNTLGAGSSNAAFGFYRNTAGTLNNIEARNCRVVQGQSTGFYVNSSVSLSSIPQGPFFDHCFADMNFTNNLTIGFSINNVDGCEIANCNVVNSNGNIGSLGFMLRGTSNILLENCVSQYNESGFSLLNCSGTTIRHSSALANANIGFIIDTLSSNTVLQGCLAAKNGNAGIYSVSSSTTLVDIRSSQGATNLNPAYSLNNNNDSIVGATVVITS